MKTLLLTIFAGISTTFMVAQTAKQIIEEVVEATGGKAHFYNQKDVTYNIHYKTPPGDNAIEFKGKETYVFNEEKSHADYEIQTITGADEEGYDGTNAWAKIDGKLTDNEQALGVAHFLRKTNYY